MCFTLATNEKVLAKCGLDWTKSSIQNRAKPILFQIVKLRKKNNMKSSGG